MCSRSTTFNKDMQIRTLHETRSKRLDDKAPSDESDRLGSLQAEAMGSPDKAMEPAIHVPLNW